MDEFSLLLSLFCNVQHLPRAVELSHWNSQTRRIDLNFSPHYTDNVLVTLTSPLCSKLGRGSSVGIATHCGLEVRGSNPGGGQLLCTCPDQPWGPPSLLYNGYWVLPGVKQPGHGIDHPFPSSTEVKERVELYVYSPSGPSWFVIGWTLPFTFIMQ